MATPERPDCPACTRPVYRLQRSRGVVAAYPCNCWLTVEAARRVVQQWREQ